MTRATSVTLAFWECGHVEVDSGRAHPCDDRDVCSATYQTYAPASAILDAIREQERLRALLRNALGAMGEARLKLSPGMRAGTAETIEILDRATREGLEQYDPPSTSEAS